jgi:hypothetical protein
MAFPKTRRQIGLRRLQETLHEIAPPTKELLGYEELEAVLPLEDRRSNWRELQSAGFELPELEMSPQVFWIAALMVLTPLGLLCLVSRIWFVIWSFVEFTILAYKLTRPLAVHPPDWCRTVGQAALCLRDIRMPDGQAVAWTRAEVAERVRMIVAEHAGVPIEEVTEDTRLADLFGC